MIGLAEAIAPLPLAGSTQWPDGSWFNTLMDRPGLSVMIFAPRGVDRQTSHERDEIYIGARGHATLQIEGKARSFGAGQIAFVPRLVQHRFVTMSPDFAAWVVFVDA
ncbi:cupin domain-containing protein [Sphingomonas nostoxanthinifaciens]|uniref:cupin domain-containing protein n=1 Tax=Sphingomonas nostoxanthinifaciens TaxID=2872652 RepID=UPI001CC1D2F6|nr:cupin domain-containing protein [Sphingomonas nostoxanthinifaciens]UAK22893.1 cupin domain-containing protein [Sphingomonas nostoxanthinifaciens]